MTRNLTSYSRAVRINGTNATIVSFFRGMLSTFTFSTADRRLPERVDVQVNSPRQPAPDTDRDGPPDCAEVIDGTDPADPNLVFKASADLQPALGGCLIIRWSSVTGKTYSVHRTSDLPLPFTAVALNVPASPPQNQFCGG